MVKNKIYLNLFSLFFLLSITGPNSGHCELKNGSFPLFANFGLGPWIKEIDGWESFALIPCAGDVCGDLPKTLLGAPIEPNPNRFSKHPGYLVPFQLEFLGTYNGKDPMVTHHLGLEGSKNFKTSKLPRKRFWATVNIRGDIKKLDYDYKMIAIYKVVNSNKSYEGDVIVFQEGSAIKMAWEERVEYSWSWESKTPVFIETASNKKHKYIRSYNKTSYINLIQTYEDNKCIRTVPFYEYYSENLMGPEIETHDKWLNEMRSALYCGEVVHPEEIYP
jgi:hypothetical protein